MVANPSFAARDTRAALSAMLAFAQDAATLALDLRAAGLSVAHKGDGFGQALTEADQAISLLMRQRFGPRMIEEETAECNRKEQERARLDEDAWTFIGDPIDGTAPFAAGLPGWGIMVAACRRGWPVASVMILPAWVDERDRWAYSQAATDQRGLILAASEGRAFWAPTRHGRMIGGLQPLEARDVLTRHVGWLPVAARHYTLDYTQGFFPLCESGFVADAAALAIGRLDATTFNHKLWDLAPTLPVLEAIGFELFRWPTLDKPPANIIDLFDETYACHPSLWLICKSKRQAALLAKAIARADKDL